MFRILSKQSLPAHDTKMLILLNGSIGTELVRYIDINNEGEPTILVIQDDGGSWYIPQNDWNMYAWIQVEELCKEVFGALE